MAGPSSPAFVKVIDVIDAFSDRSGTLFSWMIFPLVAGLTYEVFARYAFSAPTIWAFDLTYMLYGSHFMLGAGYALLRGAHIRTDLLYEKYSARQKGMVDAIAYLFFFFPGLLFFLISGMDEAIHAWTIRELSEQTAWRPPLYPFKTVVPVAAALLIVQGVSELLKSLYAVKTGRTYKRQEAVQI
jgi:TRAP-type mannitol/chloroaromatic compound transport system permease small subunit